MNKADKEAVLRYVRNICEVLQITPPELRFAAEVPGTDTTLAACSSDGMEIVVKDAAKPSTDMYFAISHELRHVWQIRTAPGKYILHYKTREELDVEAYNLQPAEIDANAFAMLAMINMFGQRPVFAGMSENVRGRIFDRARKIAEEMI